MKFNVRIPNILRLPGCVNQIIVSSLIRGKMETIFLFFNNNLSAFSVIEIDALDDARICCACTAILTKGRARLVKKPAIQKPGKVEQARLRVEAAIKRLEATLTARDESTDDVAVLNARIQSLLEANATLRQNNHEIGARIDSAIERLRSAIGG